jgi:hypothetical protein
VRDFGEFVLFGKPAGVLFEAGRSKRDSAAAAAAQKVVAVPWRGP